MGVDETAVLRIGADDERIEDLFTRTDFSRYVLEDDSESGAPSNSTRMKAERRNKVLSAKRFFDRARSGDSQLQLEAGTKQKFGQLLSLIADRLSKSAPRHQARSEADLVPMPQSTANNIRA
jgi:hypothetical protein